MRATYGPEAKCIGEARSDPDGEGGCKGCFHTASIRSGTGLFGTVLPFITR